MGHPRKDRDSAPCDAFIRQALDYAQELSMLAEESEHLCRGNGCGMLFGVVRECAYRIRIHAQYEREHCKAAAGGSAGNPEKMKTIIDFETDSEQDAKD